jgi:hypothetical protein
MGGMNKEGIDGIPAPWMTCSLKMGISSKDN